ncbi:hypothetical protein [Microtetraspora malaysiensis]|uniref:Uncharacterized protein n=1 Tax=Microtetraspora malaysiensis TaxID=161358 RepID=A0ABW6SY07_9ACTN
MPSILQVLGYVLMDYTDQHKIDAVGVYLSRASALITWPLEDYLALLGARRRDPAELRTAFAQLLGYDGCRADDDATASTSAASGTRPGVGHPPRDIRPECPRGCAPTPACTDWLAAALNPQLRALSAAVSGAVWESEDEPGSQWIRALVLNWLNPECLPRTSIGDLVTRRCGP